MSPATIHKMRSRFASWSASSVSSHAPNVELADYRGGDPTGAPHSIAGMVARGEYLTRAADCAACHTAPGGKPFAGGLAFPLPFLVEALGHCGECHKPRNLLYGLSSGRKFAGAMINGWEAYNITSDPAWGIGAWSDAQLADYLSSGHAEGRSSAAGPDGRSRREQPVLPERGRYPRYGCLLEERSSQTYVHP
jgi:mono/diheme cytochrome c family protein